MSISRKKVYEIVKSTKDPITSLEMEDGSLRKFGKQTNAFVETDPGRAKFIEEVYGRYGSGDVVVCEVDNAGSHYPRKVFSFDRIPWKDEDDDII